MAQILKTANPMDVFLEGTAILEIRMQNDANGNPIYVGYAQKPNLGTAVEQWFIVNITYDGNNAPTRVQLPDNGVEFKYAWDDRATLFS